MAAHLQTDHCTRRTHKTWRHPHRGRAACLCLRPELQGASDTMPHRRTEACLSLLAALAQTDPRFPSHEADLIAASRYHRNPVLHSPYASLTHHLQVAFSAEQARGTR